MLVSSAGARAASRTLVLLCSAVPQSPPLTVGRRAILHGTAAAVIAPALLVFPTVASAATDVVVVGQVRYDVKLPPGATATITARVVGRNSNGPVATLVIPDLGASPSPVDFVITRADMREVPDFVWLDQDLYLKADVVVNGKPVLAGRGKAKAVEGQGDSIDTRHTKPLVDLSRV